MLPALILKELQVLSRDIHGLAALFVLPVIFIVVMSMALKDVYSPRVDQLAWAALDNDNTELSKKLLQRWEEENGTPLNLPTNWQDALQAGKLKYVIHLEKGAETDLSNPEKPAQPHIILQADPAMDVGVYTSLTTKIQALSISLRAEYFIQQLSTSPEQSTLNISHDVIKGTNLTRTERSSSGPRPTSVQHNVPAWLVFGMFFVVTTIAGLFVEERNSGTLSRLFSLGANPLQLLAAKVIPFLLINSIQAALMLSVGVFIIPLLGGDALSLQGIHLSALVAMLMSISLAAICLALLVATLVRSQAQVSAIGPMMNILMAALGGIMVPAFVMPPAMQYLSHFSPMNWALEGLLDVLLRGGDLTSIAAEASQLLSLALLCICLAYLLFRFKKS